MTHNKLITQKQKRFLTNFIPKTCNFYKLSKVHKPEKIKITVKTQRSEYTEIPNFSHLELVTNSSRPSMLHKQTQQTN